VSTGVFKPHTALYKKFTKRKKRVQLPQGRLLESKSFIFYLHARENLHHTYVYPYAVRQFTVCANHEGIWWSGGIALLILNLGTKWRSVVSLAPRKLHAHGNKPLPSLPANGTQRLEHCVDTEVVLDDSDMRHISCMPSMSHECWVLSRTGFRDVPISQEEFYTLWHVRVWCRNLKNAAALTCVGLLHQGKKAKPLAPMANRTTNRRHSARIQVAALTALSRLRSTKLKSFNTSGVHKFSNNLGTTSNF
jgi:hypothetical protein